MKYTHLGRPPLAHRHLVILDAEHVVGGTTTVVGLAGHISAGLRLAAAISTPNAPDTTAAA